MSAHKKQQPKKKEPPKEKKNIDNALADRILVLEKELTATQKKLEEKEAATLRALADMQNIRRRADADRLRLPQMGAERVFRALLPLLDNLELAMKNAPQSPNDFEAGILSIGRSFLPTLATENLQKIDEVGGEVDYNLHEVLMSEGSGKVVTEILQTGYSFGDTILRHAKVKAGDERK